MAWQEIIIFIYVDTQEHVICCVRIHFYPTALYPREKPFGQHWDRTRLASSTSEHAIHYAIASRACERLRFGFRVLCEEGPFFCFASGTSFVSDDCFVFSSNSRMMIKN